MSLCQTAVGCLSITHRDNDLSPAAVMCQMTREAAALPFATSGAPSLPASSVVARDEEISKGEGHGLWSWHLAVALGNPAADYHPARAILAVVFAVCSQVIANR
jgi:hypothetical protein